MDINLDLSDQFAVVTGGTRGIGQAVAESLAEAGAAVAICGRDTDKLSEVETALRQHQPDSFAREVDVRDESDQRAFFQAVDDRFGSLDICVPNAGVAHLGNVSDTTLEEWNRDLETNLTGYFLTAKLALERMKETGGGEIIPIISKAGRRHFELRASYCSSKWGARGFTGCLRAEAESYGVRVQAVSPASVATPFQEGNPRGTDWMMDPDDVAETVCYLLGLPDHVFVDEILIQNNQKPE